MMSGLGAAKFVSGKTVHEFFGRRQETSRHPIIRQPITVGMDGRNEYGDNERNDNGENGRNEYGENGRKVYSQPKKDTLMYPELRLKFRSVLERLVCC